MQWAGLRTRWCAALALAATMLSAQAQWNAPTAALTERGQVTAGGRQAPYIIRRLPVASFPDLPAATAAALNASGCMIPQTYEAHRPENVVHGSLERAGSEDWAVLCAVKDTVTLLVFFASAPGTAMELASAQESERLQAHDPSGVLGFNWGIDAATPEDVHDAQAGLEPRPARIGHDALADSVVEHRTVYHFYEKRAWTLLDMPQ
ncbi:MAG: hypothetical protein WCA37_08755 [Terracidiphilus sp.]